MSLLSTNLVANQPEAVQSKSSAPYGENELARNGGTVRPMHPGLFNMKKDFVEKESIVVERENRWLGWFKKGFEPKADGKGFDYFAAQ